MRAYIRQYKPCSETEDVSDSSDNSLTAEFERRFVPASARSKTEVITWNNLDEPEVEETLTTEDPENDNVDYYDLNDYIDYGEHNDYDEDDDIDMVDAYASLRSAGREEVDTMTEEHVNQPTEYKNKQTKLYHNWNSRLPKLADSYLAFLGMNKAIPTSKEESAGGQVPCTCPAHFTTKKQVDLYFWHSKIHLSYMIFISSFTMYYFYYSCCSYRVRVLL